MSLRVGLALVLVLLFLAPPPPAGAAETAWVKPVDGRVVRPFDPPKSRFGAGHLGVDFAAAPGTPVRSAGPGTVTFAGTVAGALHVVVAHAGGLRTSYSFLATTSVRRGQEVRAGAVVGTSGGTGTNHDGAVVHLGLRAGETYVDPMQLFTAVDLSEVVHLAPTSEPFGFTVAQERRGLLDGLGGALGGLWDTGAGALHTLGHASAVVLSEAWQPLAEYAKWGGELAVRRIEHVLLNLPPLRATSVALTLLGAIKEYVWDGRNCDDHAPPADGTGGSGHDAMVVAGIRTETGADGRTVDLPVDALGYQADEVTYFSYATGGGAYREADTYAPIMDSARNLAAQLREHQVREPGREVDLLAHSQGGVVVRAFLAYFYDPGDPSFPPLGTVVTFASPLDGAPLATAVSQVQDVLFVGEPALDAIDALPIGPPDLDSAALRDLDEDSAFMRDLRASHLNGSIDITTIGATFDVVVPGQVATGAGARHIVVNTGVAGAHSGVLQDGDALRAARSALEGR
ncbi:MAG TPA: peptidoglycan DD-metalloendopeptidase family protein, partial [Acidimicrobiia bacterium]|nr:peptidoglycan DD-metalloendopeptidase family protein [Acidimicrobiia bacterium]